MTTKKKEKKKRRKSIVFHLLKAKFRRLLLFLGQPMLELFLRHCFLSHFPRFKLWTCF
jgi:hypothetical protein